jgi:hypothetical protein
MNEVLIKGMVRPLIPVIKNQLPKLNTLIKDQLKNIQLVPGESEAVYFIVIDKHDKAKLVTACIDTEDKITRVIDSKDATDFILNLLNLI